MICQEWPATLTRVEIATHVRNHMLEQGCRAASALGCRYRMPNGNACAAGCLLTDEEVKLVPEGQAFNERAITKQTIKVPDRLLPHIRLIRVLQLAHDNSTTVGFVIAQCERVIAGETLEGEHDSTLGSTYTL